LVQFWKGPVATLTRAWACFSGRVMEQATCSALATSVRARPAITPWTTLRRNTSAPAYPAKLRLRLLSRPRTDRVVHHSGRDMGFGRRYECRRPPARQWSHLTPSRDSCATVGLLTTGADSALPSSQGRREEPFKFGLRDLARRQSGRRSANSRSHQNQASLITKEPMRAD
jgi:hypothetical protein